MALLDLHCLPHLIRCSNNGRRVSMLIAGPNGKLHNEIGCLVTLGLE